MKHSIILLFAILCSATAIQSQEINRLALHVLPAGPAGYHVDGFPIRDSVQKGNLWKPFDAGTIVIQVPVGLAFGGAGFLALHALTKEPSGGESRVIYQGIVLAAGSVLAALALPTGVYFGGKWKGGNGSYLITLLGGLVGGGIGLLPNLISGSGEVATAIVAAGTLGLAGSVVGYHLSASPADDVRISTHPDSGPVMGQGISPFSQGITIIRVQVSIW